jgi:hypothetical protein
MDRFHRKGIGRLTSHTRRLRNRFVILKERIMTSDGQTNEPVGQSCFRIKWSHFTLKLRFYFILFYFFISQLHLQHIKLKCQDKTNNCICIINSSKPPNHLHLIGEFEQTKCNDQ